MQALLLQVLLTASQFLKWSCCSDLTPSSKSKPAHGSHPHPSPLVQGFLRVLSLQLMPLLLLAPPILPCMQQSSRFVSRRAQ
jgi:hypothetical protein